LTVSASSASAASRDARVGARRPVALRLLSQTFSAPISSTPRFETTEFGATSVTSTFELAHSSRCLSSSHSFPFGDRPLIFTSAHSPNIFFPNIRKASFPFRSPSLASSGSVSSHVPWSQMMTFPAP
jgi:hypothetical protein